MPGRARGRADQVPRRRRIVLGGSLHLAPLRGLKAWNLEDRHAQLIPTRHEAELCLTAKVERATTPNGVRSWSFDLLLRSSSLIGPQSHSPSPSSQLSPLLLQFPQNRGRANEGNQRADSLLELEVCLRPVRQVERVPRVHVELDRSRVVLLGEGKVAGSERVVALPRASERGGGGTRRTEGSRTHLVLIVVGCAHDRV